MPQHIRECCTIVRKDMMTLFTMSLLLVCICRVQSLSQEVPTRRLLKATSIQIPPFLMVTGNDKDKNKTMKGFIVDLLEEVEKIMDVSFEIVLVKDAKWGNINDEGNWTGMIGEVKSGHADVAAAPLTVTSKRLLHVDMSHPFITYGLKIVIKKPNIRDSWNDIFLVLQPFTSEAWILILLACGVTGATLGVIGRFSPFEWTNTAVVQVSKEKRESFSWQNSFWYIITTFMWQGYRHFPRSYSGRILSIFWWTFALFTLILYIGCSVAHLRSKSDMKTGLPFLTFDEMSMQKTVTYGTLKSSSTLKYFQNSDRETEQRIYKNMLNFKDNMVTSVSQGLEKVRSSNGRYAFIMEGSLAEYAVSRYPCDLMSVGDDIYKHSYSFVTDKGSPLSSELNHAVIKMQEMGIIEKINSKWKLGECFKKISQEYFIDGRAYYDKMQETASFSSLGVRLIGGPLILLLIGIVVSGAVLAAEIFFAKSEMKRGSLSTEDGHQLRDSFEDGN